MDVKKAFSSILGKYFTETPDKEIFEACKKLSIHDNLIFKIRPDRHTLYSIITSLVYQEVQKTGKFVDIQAIGSYDVIRANFKEATFSLTDITETSRYLLIHDIGQLRNHEYYAELFPFLLNSRMFAGKHTILFLSEKGELELMDKDTLANFKIVDLKGKSIANAKPVVVKSAGGSVDVGEVY